jgi:hypothetical protein
MGRRSCSLRPESARGRVMMAPPVGVAGLCPRLGDVEAPPKPRSSLSSVAEVGSEPQVRVRRRLLPGAGSESEPWGRAKRSSSSSGAEPKSEPWVGRGGDHCLLGPSPSPSPGSGRVRCLPGLSPSPSPGSGGVRRLPGLSPSPSLGSGGVRRLPGPSASPSPGSGGAELPMVPLAGPDCLSVSLCQVAPQSEWCRQRCPSVRPVSGAAK